MSEINCRAVIMDAHSGAENTYRFTAPADILSHPADEIVERFMDHMNEIHYTHNPIRWELNSAMKNRDAKVVTALGHLLFEHGDIPFMAMIAIDKA